MSSATLIMRSSVAVHGRVLLWASVLTAASVMASFSNIHYEFNDAANFLNIDHHNETKAITDFAQIVASRIEKEMLSNPNTSTMPCSPFHKTFKTHVRHPKHKIRADCRDGYIGNFTAVDVASPISINEVHGTVFNVSVLFRFRGFTMTYRNVTLWIENEPPRHVTADMVFHEDSYFRLNVSFDKTNAKPARLLDISLPHYCVDAYEMWELNNNDSYLVQEMRPHIRQHFEAVEKHRLLDFLCRAVKCIVESTPFVANLFMYKK